MLLDMTDGRDQLIHLGRQGLVEAGEQLLGRDQAQVAARGRDGDRRDERRSNLGRHGDGRYGR